MHSHTDDNRLSDVSKNQQSDNTNTEKRLSEKGEEGSECIDHPMPAIQMDISEETPTVCVQSGTESESEKSDPLKESGECDEDEEDEVLLIEVTDGDDEDTCGDKHENQRVCEDKENQVGRNDSETSAEMDVQESHTDNTHDAGSSHLDSCKTAKEVNLVESHDEVKSDSDSTCTEPSKSSHNKEEKDSHNYKVQIDNDSVHTGSSQSELESGTSGVRQSARTRTRKHTAKSEQQRGSVDRKQRDNSTAKQTSQMDSDRQSTEMKLRPSSTSGNLTKTSQSESDRSSVDSTPGRRTRTKTIKKQQSDRNSSEMAPVPVRQSARTRQRKNNNSAKSESDNDGTCERDSGVSSMTEPPSETRSTCTKTRKKNEAQTSGTESK